MKYVFGLCVFIAFLTWLDKVKSLEARRIDCALFLTDYTAFQCDPGLTELLIIHLAFWLAAYLVAYGIVTLLRLHSQVRYHQQTSQTNDKRAKNTGSART